MNIIFNHFTHTVNVQLNINFVSVLLELTRIHLVNTIEDTTIVNKNKNLDITQFDSVNIFMIIYLFLDDSLTKLILNSVV